MTSLFDRLEAEEEINRLEERVQTLSNEYADLDKHCGMLTEALGFAYECMSVPGKAMFSKKYPKAKEAIL